MNLDSSSTSTLLKGKIVIVTGGSGLLGQSFVRNVALSGGVPIIADIDNHSGSSVRERIMADIGVKDIDFFQLDITEKKSIQCLIEFAVEKYGKIDAIVNCAYPRNSNYGRKLFDVEYSDFCTNVNSHLGGYFLTSQQLAQYFITQGHGNIINIASVYGILAPRFAIYDGTEMTVPVEYAAIKSAIIQLTKYMASYLKDQNVRVNAISPGGIFDNQPSPFIEKYRKFCINKGMLNESDISGTLIYLLSDMSKYVNGQNIVVDDGFSL